MRPLRHRAPGLILDGLLARPLFTLTGTLLALLLLGRGQLLADLLPGLDCQLADFFDLLADLEVDLLLILGDFLLENMLFHEPLHRVGQYAGCCSTCRGSSDRHRPYENLPKDGRDETCEHSSPPPDGCGRCSRRPGDRGDSGRLGSGSDV